MSDFDTEIDWRRCTFTGSELESLRAWQRLSFDEKLQANEEMNAFFDQVIQQRQKHGQPYIDPNTGQLVKPAEKQKDER